MSKRWTIEKVRELIESFNCELLSEKYLNTTSSLSIRCECGEIFERTLKVINRKNSICRCDKCTRKHTNNSKIKYSFEEVHSYVKSQGCKLLSSSYEGCRQKLKIECPNHHEFNMDFLHFHDREQRCPYCYGNAKSTQQEVEEYLNEYGYKLLSTYEGNNKSITIECPKGHITDTMTYARFKDGCRCVKCNESKGEREIENLLKDYDVHFFDQYRFEDCKFKNTLPFDFYLPQHNICIEYDGEQHFKIKDWFGGLDGFVDRIIRDTIKNEYCKNNGIKLIRIPYLEYENIRNILIKELKLK